MSSLDDEASSSLDDVASSSLEDEEEVGVPSSQGYEESRPSVSSSMDMMLGSGTDESSPSSLSWWMALLLGLPLPLPLRLVLVDALAAEEPMSSMGSCLMDLRMSTKAPFTNL